MSKLAGACGLLALACNPPAPAGGWDCTNKDIAEIQCGGQGCAVETAAEGFTPIEVRISGNRISICAYSGCFGGAVQMAGGEGPHSFWSGAVSPDSATQGSDVLSLVIDRPSGTGILLWRGFANPLQCASVAPR